MGLGAQLISWDDAFCERLVRSRFQVIRFDNRDSGLSTQLDGLGAPDLLSALAGTAAPGYGLGALAADAAELMVSLRIDAAHIVGMSMGGMIAQLLAIDYPERVLSLTTMMSDTGGRSRVLAEPEVLSELVAAPLNGDVGDAIEQAVRLRRVLSGARDFDEAAARERATRLVKRAYHPAGALRQAAAVLAAPDRTEQLGRVRVRTLVVHGTSDPLVPFENGMRVHRAIPGSRLLALEGVGHDLPPAAAERVIEALLKHLR